MSTADLALRCVLIACCVAPLAGAALRARHAASAAAWWTAATLVGALAAATANPLAAAFEKLDAALMVQSFCGM